MVKAVFSIAIVLAITTLNGCRSAQRFGSMVRVTEDPNANIADVPAPEQRLATTKTTAPETDEMPRRGLVAALAGMPKVFQQDRATNGQGSPAIKESLTGKPSDVIQTRLASSRTNAGTKNEGASLSISDATMPKAPVSGTQLAKEKPKSTKPETPTNTAKQVSPKVANSPSVETPSKTTVADNTVTQDAQQGLKLTKQVPSAATRNALDGPVSTSLSDLPPVSVRLPDSMPIEKKDSELVQRRVDSSEDHSTMNKDSQLGGLVASSTKEMVDKPSVRPVKEIDSGREDSNPSKELTAKKRVASIEPSKERSVASSMTATAMPSTEIPSDQLVVSDATADANAAKDSHQIDDLPSVERTALPSTRHPNSLANALQSKLHDLPKVPNVTRKEDAPAPRRIGQSVTSTDSVAHVGDSESIASVSQPGVPERILNANQVRPVSHRMQPRVSRETPQSVEVASAPVPPKPEPVELSEQELFAKLLEKVSKPVKDETATQRERRLIMVRHLMVLAGDPSAATEKMEGLNETEQRYLKNQLIGLWTMIDPEGHPSSGRRITEALPKFQEATRYMAAATDSLRLKNLEFCTEIESYGQIKPFEGNRFVSGQQVILYCEVENFASSKTGELYQTKLQGNYDIYDASGTKVISQRLPVDQQKSRNHLRDYFVAYQLNLPRQLTSGTYRMQLTIEDAVGKKYGQAEVPFEIE